MIESNAVPVTEGTPPPAPERQELPFEFKATGGEYFRIWIVNLLLTLLTLGIFSAWAKVRRLRYFYGSTYLDGHSFEYHGQPLAILKGRLIVVGIYAIFAVCNYIWPLTILFVLPVIIFIVPWIIMRSRMFQMRMSSYRNIRFNFHGNYKDALAVFIGWPILVVLTVYLLTPVWLRKRVEYSLGNAAYGRERFRFVTATGTFYRFWLITIGLSIAAYFAVSIVVGIMFAVVGVAGGFGSGDPSQVFMALMSGGGIVLVLVGVALMLVISAYYKAQFTNASFGGVEIGPNYLISRLKTRPLAVLYLTNMLGIVFTLGLFYPWAVVRQLKYQLDNTALSSTGLSHYTASATQATGALGEEVGDFFDVDFGL